MGAYHINNLYCVSLQPIQSAVLTDDTPSNEAEYQTVKCQSRKECLREADDRQHHE